MEELVEVSEEFQSVVSSQRNRTEAYNSSPLYLLSLVQIFQSTGNVKAHCESFGKESLLLLASKVKEIDKPIVSSFLPIGNFVG